jgi:hypothetical protein
VEEELMVHQVLLLHPGNGQESKGGDQMKAITIGEKLAGTAAGTITGVCERAQAIEILLKSNSGAGTVTVSLWVQDPKGHAYDTGKSVAVNGSGTTKATVISPIGGGVPLGFAVEGRIAVSGTINYDAYLVGRL